MGAISDRLAGIRLKIERAKHHIRDFESRLEAFRATDPYGTATEDDPQTGDRIHKVRIVSPIPDDFSLVIGEAIYQLRSSLDHLAWQLVEANGVAPDGRTAFPICKTAPKKKADFLAKVKGMSAGAISAVKTVQPYQCGDDTLWKLTNLNNIDKHRFLLVTGVWQGAPAVDIELSLALSNRLPGIQFVGTGELKDGTVIGRLTGPNAAKMKADFQVPFEIAFSEPQIVQGQPVLPLLHQLSEAIDNIISRFVPLL